MAMRFRRFCKQGTVLAHGHPVAAQPGLDLAGPRPRLQTLWVQVHTSIGLIQILRDGGRFRQRELAIHQCRHPIGDGRLRERRVCLGPRCEVQCVDLEEKFFFAQGDMD